MVHVKTPKKHQPFRSNNTLSEIVQLFTDRGVKVTDYAEADVDPPYDAHWIEFDGDYDDAMRTVVLALACDFRICSLHQNWIFCGREMGRPNWQIMIFASDEDDED